MKFKSWLFFDEATRYGDDDDDHPPMQPDDPPNYDLPLPKARALDNSPLISTHWDRYDPSRDTALQNEPDHMGDHLRKTHSNHDQHADEKKNYRHYIGWNPDTLNSKSVDGWTFYYDPDTNQFRLDDPQNPHDWGGRVRGRIRFASSRDHLAPFKTSKPLITIWNTTPQDAESLVKGIKSTQEFHRIPNILQAHFVINGDYYGPVGDFRASMMTNASSVGDQEITVGSKKYKIKDMAALLHTLPKLSPERSAIENYIKNANDPRVQDLKARLDAIHGGQKHPWQVGMEKQGMVRPGQKWWAPTSEYHNLNYTR